MRAPKLELWLDPASLRENLLPFGERVIEIDLEVG